MYRTPLLSGTPSPTVGPSNDGQPITDGTGDGITPQYVQDLTVAAHAALNSLDRNERDAAADRLLFLSSFDHWEATTKRLLPYCQDNCLRFIVCKALYFMVANELGPQERAEMKLYVLKYTRERTGAGEKLPVYVQHELYLVYASALFSNWKIAVISELNNLQNSSMDGDQGPHSDGGPPTPTGFELAAQIIEELMAYLTPEQVLDCLNEVIAYFFQHVSKVAIPSLRQAFVNTLLPYFFDTATHALQGSPRKAAEVCCAVLECLSPLTNGGGLLNVKYTTEPSIHILRWADGWANALAVVMQYAASSLSANPTGTEAPLLGRLVQLCSRIDSPHEMFMRQGRDPLASSLLQVSTDLLLVCQRDNRCIPDLLSLSCSILVNAFERHEDAVILFLTQNFTQMMQTWAEATQFVLGRFSDDEADLRQLLMHMYYLFADRLLPKRVPRRRRAGTTQEMDLDKAFYGAPNAPGASTPPRTTNGTSEPYGSEYEEREGPLDKDRSQQLADFTRAVFTAYLAAVIEKAHLREDSDELRFESGVSLHNERTLYPLAEMLYCDKMEFLPMMMDRLRSAIRDFEVCAGARESALRSGGGAGALTPETAERLSQIVASVDPAQVQGFIFHSGDTNGSDGAYAMFLNFHQSPLSLFLMRVCLSRLSVLISVFAIAIMRNVHDTSDEILQVMASFARNLLTENDDLTNEMLQTLNLFDLGMDDGVEDGTGFHFGGASSVAAQTLKPTVHLGILRALFFFCNCVLESSFDRRPEFIDIMLDLLRFVYLQHSEEAALMVDANVLFKRVMTEAPSTGRMLSSDKLTAVIQAVEEDAIPALRLPSPVNPPLPPAARNGFFTAFTAFVETRFYAGFPVGNVMHTMLHRALSPSQRLQPFTIPTLEEAVAIAQGISEPDTLLVALDAAMSHREVLIQHVMRADADAAAHVIKLLSVLCELSRRLMQDDAARTTQWDWISLVLNAITQYFSLVSLSVPNQTPKLIYADSGAYSGSITTKFYEFKVDAVAAEVVYDLAQVMQTVCTATWSNLGVVCYYERPTVERFFCGVVQILTSVSPPLLMSSERGKKLVFDAMITALTTEGEVFKSLHLLLMRQRVWQHVLDHLTRCLQYDYIPEIIQAMVLILRHDAEARTGIPNYIGIGERQLAAAFHEVAVLIAVAPFLEIRQLSYVFSILRICYTYARDLCDAKMKTLLGFCSAYHRVRLRTIWGKLMNGEKEMMDSYVSVFGQSSKVGVLSAW